MKHLLSLLILFLLVSAANAATWYVASPTGTVGGGVNGVNASGTTCQSISHPCANISYTCGLAVAAGDTIYVRSGTFAETTLEECNKSGTSGNLVTITNYDTENPSTIGSGDVGYPILDFSGASNHGWYEGSISYVKMNGLIIQNILVSGASGFECDACTNLTFSNNVVRNTYQTGVLIDNTLSTSGSSTNCNNITVTGNYIYSTVFNNLTFINPNSGGWGQGLTLQQCPTSTVSQNKIYNNGGEGIGIQGSAGPYMISQNVVHDNFSQNIYTDGAKNVTIDRNYVYNTPKGESEYPTGTRVAAVWHTAFGISFAAENAVGGLWFNPTNEVVTNNLIIDTDANCCYFYDGVGGTGIVNSLVANNTFVSLNNQIIQEGNVRIDTDAVSSGNVFTNNLSVMPSGGTQPKAYGSTPTGWTISYNAVYGGSGAFYTQSGGAVTGNPLVNNSGFYLGAGSPLIGTGQLLSTVTYPTLLYDFAGRLRSTTANTIGAFQY